MKQAPFERGAGVLMPNFSLQGGYGVGGLGKSAYQFVDFLQNAGQKYWQVLPLGPTGFGNSPYASHSAFAGNPYFIPLVHPPVGEETDECMRQLKGGDESRVDYARLYRFRTRLLSEYIDAFPPSRDEVSCFFERERGWLEDYALYRIAKELEDGRPWWLWENGGLRAHGKAALDQLERSHSDRVKKIYAEQYLFDEGWRHFKSYANKKGVSIIGDLPLYVARDSADVWSQRKEFLLDGDGTPSVSAGVPPDQFSQTGQLWGNPIYDWERMEASDFAWWRRRIGKCAGMFDALRLDHFIGLSRYYAIPRDRADASIGDWRSGPGEKLLRLFLEHSIPIIAEDLGVVTEETEALMAKFGIPGMKILQFAFDGDPRNPFLPHCHTENCVIYGGTHDNETLMGYFSAGGRTHRFASEYLGTEPSPSALSEASLRAGLASVSRIVVFTMADWLGLDNRARINTPGMATGNWEWRIGEGALTARLAEKMKNMTARYDR
jgi:4-alpha-glucanotransferase